MMTTRHWAPSARRSNKPGSLHRMTIIAGRRPTSVCEQRRPCRRCRMVCALSAMGFRLDHSACWRSDLTQNWCGKSDSTYDARRNASEHRTRLDEASDASVKHDERLRHADAAQRAQVIWNRPLQRQSTIPIYRRKAFAPTACERRSMTRPVDRAGDDRRHNAQACNSSIRRREAIPSGRGRQRRLIHYR